MPRWRVGAEPANGGEPAAVTHGVEQLAVLHRAVGDGVDLLAQSSGDVRSAADDDVGTEVAHQLLVGLRRVGDDPQPVRLGQLDDVAAVRTGGAGDEQRVARRQGQQVEGQACGQSVHRQRARFDVGRARRHRDDRRRRQHERLAVAAVRALGDDDRHDVVADRHAGVHVLTDLVDDAGDVHPGDVRRRAGGGEHVGTRAVGVIRVGRVDRCGVDAQAHLAGAGVALGQVDHLQRIRSVERRHTDGTHRPGVAVSPAGRRIGHGGMACRARRRNVKRGAAEPLPVPCKTDPDRASVWLTPTGRSSATSLGGGWSGFVRLDQPTA